MSATEHRESAEREVEATIAVDGIMSIRLRGRPDAIAEVLRALVAQATHPTQQQQVPTQVTTQQIPAQTTQATTATVQTTSRSSVSVTVRKLRRLPTLGEILDRKVEIDLSQIRRHIRYILEPLLQGKFIEIDDKVLVVREANKYYILHKDLSIGSFEHMYLYDHELNCMLECVKECAGQDREYECIYNKVEECVSRCVDRMSTRTEISAGVRRAAVTRFLQYMLRQRISAKAK